ncbi:ABC transporter permease [Halomonas heilongjiangensis]|uniref:Sugar phosphate isomerase/epimerase n=2 Tax=Halomonas heilongjiangensis TaxID=1387883 RepID=A0A2N7TLX1_9GAMM|nr:sugar phosphate isomerase/epimerase [Halomonas heilongjiangensis]PXX94219.1 ABC transporter permease [Halomonas heilongjiangensis]
MVPFPRLSLGASPGPATLVATSAYGRTLIEARGQAAVLPWLTEAGADGVEIRRELLPAGFTDFVALGRDCAAQGLTVVYSAADLLWDGTHPATGLDARLREAVALGAAAVKVSLGHYAGADEAAWTALRTRLAAAPPLLVENDQTPEGGTPEPLAACLEDAAAAGCPLAMTFDIGNWHWTGSDPLAAARRLGRFVRYLHCKGVAHDADRPRARVPDDAELAAWEALLAHFPADLPRAIEYPLEAPDPVALTAEQLSRLRRL